MFELYLGIHTIKNGYIFIMFQVCCFVNCACVNIFRWFTSSFCVLKIQVISSLLTFTFTFYGVGIFLTEITMHKSAHLCNETKQCCMLSEIEHNDYLCLRRIYAQDVLFTICINYTDLDDCLTTSDANTLNGIYYSHRRWF